MARKTRPTTTPLTAPAIVLTDVGDDDDDAPEGTGAGSATVMPNSPAVTSKEGATLEQLLSAAARADTAAGRVPPLSRDVTAASSASMWARRTAADAVSRPAEER